MTENHTDSKATIETLKETLYTQQKLLQKLYNELEVERESSATAASEALAMILRLQGEKAAVKMEAEQYKRLAEEKMYHAEESIEGFEDLIYQKEAEIASLEHQVQAYRYKLSSFGINDIQVSEIKYRENMLQRNESEPESLSRRNSAPPKLLKLAYLKRDRSISPDSNIVSKRVEESDINSYWDQIRKLDKIVEEVAGGQYVNSKARSSSGFSHTNEPGQSGQAGQARSLEKTVDDDVISDTCSLSVHDVFEVPQNDEKDNGKSVVKYEKVGKMVGFMEEAMKLYDIVETGLGEKALKHEDKGVFLPRDGIVIDCNMAVELPGAGFAEGEGSSGALNTRTEITSEGEREEELRLLYEIRDKLDSLQSDIRSQNVKIEKPLPNYDLPMLQLTEAMLHFWI